MKGDSEERSANLYDLHQSHELAVTGSSLLAHETHALVQTRTGALVASYLHRCKIAVILGQNTPIASTSDIHSIDLFEYLHE
jgi:hypothetical protein